MTELKIRGLKWKRLKVGGLVLHFYLKSFLKRNLLFLLFSFLNEEEITCVSSSRVPLGLFGVDAVTHIQPTCNDLRKMLKTLELIYMGLTFCGYAWQITMTCLSILNKRKECNMKLWIQLLCLSKSNINATL